MFDPNGFSVRRSAAAGTSFWVDSDRGGFSYFNTKLSIYATGSADPSEVTAEFKEDEIVFHKPVKFEQGSTGQGLGLILVHEVAIYTIWSGSQTIDLSNPDDRLAYSLFPEINYTYQAGDKIIATSDIAGGGNYTGTAARKHVRLTTTMQELVGVDIKENENGTISTWHTQSATSKDVLIRIYRSM